MIVNSPICARPPGALAMCAGLAGPPHVGDAHALELNGF